MNEIRKYEIRFFAHTYIGEKQRYDKTNVLFTGQEEYERRKRYG